MITEQRLPIQEYEVELEEKDGKPYLGISSFARERGGVLGGIYKIIYGMRLPRPRLAS